MLLFGYYIRQIFRAALYMLFGAVLWFFGSALTAGNHAFIQNSEPAQLSVLQVDNKRGANDTIVYRPVFALETTERPRPEFAGNVWMTPKPHEAGDIVPGRYAPDSGEMRSQHMIERSKFVWRVAQVIAFVLFLQGVLMLFGVPEALMILKVRTRARTSRTRVARL